MKFVLAYQRTSLTYQNIENGVMTESLIEFIAERDEALLEHYMDAGYDEAMWMVL